MHEQRHKPMSVHSDQLSLERSNNQPEPAIFSESSVIVLIKKVSSEEIQHALTFWVEEIRDWAKENANLVGHIKLFVEGQENLWISSTGRSINIKHSQGWSEWFTDRVNLSVTAIIFGTSKETLGEVAQMRLQACLKRIKDGV